MTTITADEARATWAAVEPLHTLVYFTPDAVPAYEAAGLTNAVAGYFASRSAAMGAVRAATVIATFFNFAPRLVTSVIPQAWTEVTPERILAARFDAIDATLRRVLGDAVSSPEMEEAASLLRRGAEACDVAPGRPLAAAHAALPWPDEPHLALWHAQTVLREYRGDGHVALLVAAGLDGCEAVVTHAAAGGTSKTFALRFRSWTEEEWDAATARVDAKGWGGDQGAKRRAELEARTDELSITPYEAIGADGCARIRELCAPWTDAVYASGMLRRPRPRVSQDG